MKLKFKLQRWAKKKNIRLRYIQPGKPQQNAYVERYNRTVRYDWLTQYLFESIDEMRNFATEWLWMYTNERPNMGIGGNHARHEVETGGVGSTEKGY